VISVPDFTIRATETFRGIDIMTNAGQVFIQEKDLIDFRDRITEAISYLEVCPGCGYTREHCDAIKEKNGKVACCPDCNHGPI